MPSLRCLVAKESGAVAGTTIRRNVVMMSEADARQLSVWEGSPVSVETEVGAMRVLVSLVDIRPGNLAMYFPEANAIVPARVDPRSGTPAFKSIVARIEVAGRTCDAHGDA